MRTAVRTMAPRKPVADGNDWLSAVMSTSMNSLITGPNDRIQSSPVSTGKRPGPNFGSGGWRFEPSPASS